MGTFIEHPVPDRVKQSFVILTSGHYDTEPWVSECPDVKNCKWWFNPVWHRMLYSCTHMATVTVGVKVLICRRRKCLDLLALWISSSEILSVISDETLSTHCVVFFASFYTRSSFLLNLNRWHTLKKPAPETCASRLVQELAHVSVSLVKGFSCSTSYTHCA